MLLFTVKRLLLLIPVFLAISAVIFALVHLVPGDPIDNLLRVGATAEERAALIARLGLDLPLWQQYLAWFGKLLQGDLGDAMILRRPVADLIALNLPHSLALGSLALVFSTVVGITAGALAAIFRDTWFDRGVMTLILWAQPCPASGLGS
jgi:ABC-type dipeptide/oligopeptide/nickel transport system permease component